MTRKLFPALLLVGSFTFAQIGVNTENPNATLEVTGNPSDISKFDGIIAPKITGDQLRLKTYTSLQNGALVYVTQADSAPANQTLDVTAPGFYYFNGDPLINKWIKINSEKITEPWQIQGTGSLSTQNTDNIYQQGRVAIGTNSSTAASTKQLDVAGDFRSVYGNSGNYQGIDTNFTDSGIQKNIMYAANNSDLSAASEVSSLAVFPGNGKLQVTGPNGLRSVSVLSNASGGTFGISAGNSDQSQNVSISGNSSSATGSLRLSHSKTNAEAATVNIEKTKGVTFDFSDAVGNAQGSYSFPRTNGTANQVLTTDGATGNANLIWKDVSTISSKIRTISSGTVAADDYTVLVTGNISLPAANSSNIGKIYNLINDTISSVTVTGTFRINGGNFSDYGLNNSDLGRGIVVQSTGSAWVIISRY